MNLTIPNIIRTISKTQMGSTDGRNNVPILIYFVFWSPEIGTELKASCTPGT